MVIERDRYLDSLRSKRGNGLVKVVTGIRGGGKTFLLFEIYRNWLLGEGTREDHIIGLALDDLSGARYRDPVELDRYIRSRISDTEMYYVFLDGIRMVSEIRNPYVPDPDAKIGAVDVLLGLMKMKNVDLYVTGDSAGMLSSDIPSAFRGRGDEIRGCPLTYREFYSAYDKDKRSAWMEYSAYGGMPHVMSLDSHEEKSGYLRDLFPGIICRMSWGAAGYSMTAVSWMIFWTSWPLPSAPPRTRGDWPRLSRVWEKHGSARTR